jgi:hypothetical protein
MVDAPPSGRAMRPRPPRQVTTTEEVPVVWYQLKWKGWDESDHTWMKEEDCGNCRELIAEYELLQKQSDEEDEAAGDEKQTAAAVTELGLATEVQWRLTDRQTSSRGGQPTVRCAYATASPCEREAQPRTTTLAGAAVKQRDPCRLGWYLGRSRSEWQAWTDGVVPPGLPERASNRLSQIRYPQPPKPSGCREKDQKHFSRTSTVDSGRIG